MTFIARFVAGTMVDTGQGKTRKIPLDLGPTFSPGGLEFLEVVFFGMAKLKIGSLSTACGHG